MSFLLHYRYRAVLLLMTTEGPLTSFITAGLSAQGTFNIRYIAILALLGDVIGDVFSYSLGRRCGHHSWVQQSLGRLSYRYQKITDSFTMTFKTRINTIIGWCNKEHITSSPQTHQSKNKQSLIHSSISFSNNTKKRNITFLYLLIVKITPYIATPSLMYTGYSKFPFPRFLCYTTIISAIVKLLYLSLGYRGMVSLTQLTQGLHLWKQICIGVIGGIILLRVIKKIYRSLSQKLSKKIV